MKNIEKLRELTERRWEGEFEDPIGFDAYVNAIAECFKSESEVEEFIKTGEYDYVCNLSEAYEEIVGKFPSDRLEYLFDKFVVTSYPEGVPTAPPRQLGKVARYVKPDKNYYDVVLHGITNCVEFFGETLTLKF